MGAFFGATREFGDGDVEATGEFDDVLPGRLAFAAFDPPTQVSEPDSADEFFPGLVLAHGATSAVGRRCVCTLAVRSYRGDEERL
jgi:hypothetical protein